MRRLQCLLAVLLVALVTPPARADNTDDGPVTIQTNYISPGTRYIIPEVGEVRYYLFEEYKLLLRVDHDLFQANKMVQHLSLANEALELLVLNEREISSTYKSERDVHKERVDRLFTAWQECKKDIDKFSWETFFTGVGIGAGVALFATLIVVLSVG